ncbi:fimbrial protein [Shigella flexneri]|nr:fimbrial protein [Shigella flexneri]
MSQKNWLCSVMVGGVLLGSSGAWAEDVNVTVRGTILVPTCSVTAENGDSQVTVDFGVVELMDVGNMNAQQAFNVRVVCDDTALSGMYPDMKIQPVSGGTMQYSGRTVLGTSTSGLGIDLSYGGNYIAPGEWVSVAGVDTSQGTLEHFLQMQAILVSENASKLATGAFTASASMVMVYQ